MNENLTIRDLAIAYLIVGSIFIFTIPVISIKNEIYLLSRSIFELRTQKEVLIEENRELKHKIELIRYKQDILDQLKVDEYE
ncbi:hypothetical protein [uncultured Campylobacter sp.]|uniref:hypothetical protein n=1 Tax=uncultured Campylobacter sp. TaxID=218934 RepID=UPI0026397508|nr:hypothetical protein [uncultured Campylobacter sp.]